ncbi:hypothetical protein PN444_19330 [Dolichospermum circinale CS-541/04]|nr:hypothetical protein [Dolichospermum circinale CS-541/04]
MIIYIELRLSKSDLLPSHRRLIKALGETGLGEGCDRYTTSINHSNHSLSIKVLAGAVS